MKHHLRKTKIIAAFLLTALICSMLPGGALPVSAKAQAGELPAEENISIFAACMKKCSFVDTGRNDDESDHT